MDFVDCVRNDASLELLRMNQPFKTRRLELFWRQQNHGDACACSMPQVRLLLAPRILHRVRVDHQGCEPDAREFRLLLDMSLVPDVYQ